VRYREQAPPAELAPWVECGWAIEPGEPIRNHRVLPDGCIDVLWSARFGVSVVGPMTRALVAPLGASSRVAGIRFRPGAAPALLGLPADALLDARVPVAELLGDDGARLEEDVAEAPAAPLAALRCFAARRAARSPRPDPLVAEAVRRIEAGRGLADLGVSARHLRRRFAAEVGYGPKRLERVLRLRRALDRAGEHGLAAAAFTAGYADQSHFTNDCVALAGIAPGRFLQDVAA
jgi:AraC-like DNA-binding protein